MKTYSTPNRIWSLLPWGLLRAGYWSGSEKTRGGGANGGGHVAVQGRGVAVEPAVEGDPAQEGPGHQPPCAEGQYGEAAARGPGGLARFAGVASLPHLRERATKRHRPLEARLDGAGEAPNTNRPGQGSKVGSLAGKAIAVDAKIGLGLLSVERAVPRKGDLGDPQIAEARGVPGGGRGVVGPGQECPPHAEGSRSRAEGQAGAPGEVDLVLLEQQLLGGLGGGSGQAADDHGEGEPGGLPAQSKRGEGGTTRRCPSHREKPA